MKFNKETMEMIKNLLIKSVLSAAVIAAFTLPAHATNGMFMPGYGAKSIGMGGAGVAYGQDGFAAAANPAGISRMGFRIDGNLGLFNAPRSAAVGTSAGASSSLGYEFDGASTSLNNLFPVPGLAATMDFDDRLTFGIAMVGAGMNTTYDHNIFAGIQGPGRATPNEKLGVDLIQIQMPMTAAYQVDAHNAVGLSFVPAVQYFKAYGLETFNSFHITTPQGKDYFTNKGRDEAHGAGLRAGWMGKYFDDRLTLGVTYASKIYMSKFKRYKGLFAQGGSLDIPANWALGIAFKPTKNTTVTLDRERILYAGVRSISNRGPFEVADTPGIPATPVGPRVFGLLLGEEGGMGFGWKSQTVYKFGVDYKYNNDWTFRAGYNYGKSPIPADQLTFNALAPAVVEKHYALGFTYSIDATSEFNFGYMYVPLKKQVECNNATPSTNVVGCVAVQMKENDFEFGYSLKF